MVRWRWFTVRVLLLVTLVGLNACSGCTDDNTANNGTNNRTEPDTEVPAGSRLEHVADGGTCSPAQPICPRDVTFSSSLALKVRLVDADGNPIDNTSINFELRAMTAAGTTLSAASGISDTSGFGSTDLRAGTTAGTVEVNVTAGGAESGVAPIKFIVAVNSKGASSYVVTFNHAGTADLKDVRVRAFEINTTCAQIAEDHVRETTPGVNPTLTAVTQQSNIAQADGTLPQIVIPNVPNGTAYSIEARAYSRDNEEVEAAWGCKDSNPPIVDGMSVTVVVDLVDNLPRLKGTYDVTHEFNIQQAICMKDAQGNYAGALPSGVCTAIDLIGRLATDPGSFLVGDSMNDGLLHLIVDFLPDGSIKDSINSFINNGFIQNLAGDVINDFARDWINNNAPAWVRNLVNITGDIYESLKRFKVNGTIRILAEPRPEYDAQSGSVIGILVPDMDGNKPGRQVWNEVVIFWTGECAAGPNFEACRQRTFSANDVGTDSVVEGFFDGTMLPISDPMNPGYGLHINEHTLTLNYGVFLLGILEKIILPSVFGDQSVTSLEAALDKLIQGIFGGANGCDGFGEWINDTVGGGGAIGETVCNNLLSQAGDFVREYMTENLTVSGEDNFLLGTPDGEPCRLNEPALYAGEWAVKPLPYVESLGENRPMMECKWNLKLKYGSAATSVIETDGTFWGTRSGF